MQWYVSQNGKTTGPFDEERLAMLVRWGKISRDAFICDQQHSAWIAIRCTAFARGLPPRQRQPAPAGGTAQSPGAPQLFDLAERGSQQALGLVAFSVILAGVLMVAL